MRRLVPLALVAILVVPVHAAATDPAALASRIAGAALVGGRSLSIVQSLVDQVGHRMAGSPAADRGVEWALREMRALGLKNVRREPVKVPRWVRGAESVEIVAPVTRALHATALGGSVATPTGGISGEILEVASFDELKSLGARAQGKIVLFNRPMLRTRGFEGYGSTVGLRGHGAVEAARFGAAAALIRSVGTGAYRLPHTGATHYDDKLPPIPFAAIAAEDADLLHRLLSAGPVKVKLRLDVGQKGEVDSANVVAEVPGKTDQLVVIGAHLDSWDLGEGALDDGAGVAIVLESARILGSLGIVPKRTIRVVLFMNEENGLSGAKAYAEMHKAEAQKHVAAMEADAGAGRPLGYAVAGDATAVALIKKLNAPLTALHLDEVTATDEAGADLIPLQYAGVPVLCLNQDMTSYFDWHHTAAETLDKIDATDLALNVAGFAWMTWALAESEERLPPPPAPPKW
jgi:Zn-dependent M28 family amino/carboxypeptidase